MSRDDYIEVSERIRMFKDAYPEGSLQSDWGFTERDGEQWLTVRAYAYRTADDARPGIGHAWEPIPGRTPYTKGSELMVGETSAWGRALAALGIAVHKGIASAQEIRSAQARTPDLAQQRADAMPAYKTPSGATKQEGHQLATAKQIGLLKGTMTKQHINEALLADFCHQHLGFELPVDGLDKLTKAQASVIIDALLKSDQPMTVTRTTAAEPDDPWASRAPTTGAESSMRTLPPTAKAEWEIEVDRHKISCRPFGYTSTALTTCTDQLRVR
jgi:hypothetical protein